MNWRNLYLFLLGAFLTINIKLGGDLSASDILILALSPWACLKLKRIWKKPIKQILILGAFYWVGLALSDYLNSSTFEDWSRGHAKVGIMLFSIGVITVVSQLKIDRLIYFFWSSSLSAFISQLLGQGEVSHLWKFGWGPVTTSFLALFCGRIFLMRKFQSLPFSALGIFHFLMNARSLAGFTLLTGLILGSASKRKNNVEIKKKKSSVRAYAAIIVFGGIVYFLYDYGASNGWFGDESRLKYEMQTVGGKSVLVGGRGEFLTSLTAIKDSPLIGYGSWPKSEKYVLLYLEYSNIELSSAKADFFLQRKLIPSHSHIFGGWMEAGIAGGLFWLYTLYLFLTTVARLVTGKMLHYGAFIIFMLVSSSWDIVFSPFGSTRRITHAVSLVVCASLFSFRGSLKNERARLLV